jgi:hypothetical protein
MPDGSKLIHVSENRKFEVVWTGSLVQNIFPPQRGCIAVSRATIQLLQSIM